MRDASQQEMCLTLESKEKDLIFLCIWCLKDNKGLKVLQGDKKSPNGEKESTEHFIYIQFYPEWVAEGMCMHPCMRAQA